MLNFLEEDCGGEGYVQKRVPFNQNFGFFFPKNEVYIKDSLGRQTIEWVLRLKTKLNLSKSTKKGMDYRNYTRRYYSILIFQNVKLVRLCRIRGLLHRSYRFVFIIQHNCRCTKARYKHNKMMISSCHGR